MKFLSGKSLALLAILSLLIIGLTFGQESKLSLIKVDGKYFKNEKGEKLIFRGFQYFRSG